jgi:ribose transport system substrate-binding protein
MKVSDCVPRHEGRLGMRNESSKKNRGWLIVGTVAILMCAGFIVGCGGDEQANGSRTEGTSGEPTGEPVEVAVFAPVINEFTKVIANGITDSVEKAGGNVTIFDDGFDATKQFNSIEDAIALGKFDAFVIFALDGAGVVPAVEEAIEAGIEVIGVNSPIGPDITEVEPQVEGQAAQVQESVTGIGGLLTELFAGACGDLDPCEVAFVSGAPATTLEKVIIGSMREELKAHPNIKLLKILDGGGYQQQAAFETTEDLLVANPDIDVIGTNGDQMTLGVELAVQNAGRVGKTKIFGAGASCVGIEALKEGRFYGTTLRVPFTDGQLAGDIAVKAVRGESHPTHVAGTDESDQPDPITADNLLDTFECQWQGA